MLTAATTCASAGIIVGVVTLTGLGLKFSAIVIGYAGGSLLLTAIYTALIVWIVGLAVPVTASYIICAVIAAPALTKLGVPDFAAGAIRSHRLHTEHEADHNQLFIQRAHGMDFARLEEEQ